MALFLMTAACWLLGVFVGRSVGLTEAGVPLALLAGSAGACIVAARPEKPRAVLFARFTLAGAACAAGMAASPPFLTPGPLPAGLARIEATVERRWFTAQGPRVRMRLHRGELLEGPTRLPPGLVLIGADRSLELTTGSRFRALCELGPSSDFRNITPHPAWPRSSPTDGYASIEGRPAIIRRDLWGHVLDRIRDRIREALGHTLDRRTSALARALVLGDRSGLTERDQRAVRNSGLSHLLAVSGLHVAIVAGLFAAMVRRILLSSAWLSTRIAPVRVAAMAGILIALNFAALVGNAPSAWRAAITASIGWFFVMLNRRPHPYGVAALAVLLLGAAQPAQAVRPGFFLSVFATAAILSRPGISEESPGRWFWPALSTTGRAMVATAPVVLWCFGSLPLIGLLANLVLVPIGTLGLVPLAAAHALLATTVPLLAQATAAPLEILSQAFLAACSTFARFDFSDAIPPPSLLQGIVFGGWALAFLTTTTTRARLLGLAIALIIIGVGEVHLRSAEQPRGTLRATFVDVAQGDAALIDLPDGRLLLIDAGGCPGSNRDPGQDAIVPLLRARRRSAVDLAVITHSHPDHYEGLPAIARRISIAELWDNGQAKAEDPTGPASRMLGAGLGLFARVRTPPCQQGRRFGDANLRVLWPCPAYDPGYDLNDNSIVLKVSLGRRSLLFTGDIEEHAERALANTDFPLRADVLKVPHHGSRTSSTGTLLEAVAPSLAIISAGRGNRFGHPHAEVVDRLEGEGVRILRTDRHGGVIVETDGDEMTAQAWSGESFSLP